MDDAFGNHIIIILTFMELIVEILSLAVSLI